MNLKANPNDVLTVLGTATDAEINLAGNLILTLDYDYSGGAPIILMRTDGEITGGFDTINGDSFLNGTLFSLTYDTNQYWFEIDYGYDLGSGFTGVALYAIPEPATVALLLGVALSGLVWLRRRRG